MLKGPVDEKLVGVCRSVLTEERGGPAIELGMLGLPSEEARKIGPLFLAVSKRMAPRKVLDIRLSARGGDAGAFEAKLGGRALGRLGVLET